LALMAWLTALIGAIATWLVTKGNTFWVALGAAAGFSLWGLLARPSIPEQEVKQMPEVTKVTEVLSQHGLDLWTMILLLTTLAFFLLYVLTRREAERAEHEKTRINQEVLQLRSDLGFAKDKSTEEAMRAHELIRDTARELVSQQARRAEVDTLVDLQREKKS